MPFLYTSCVLDCALRFLMIFLLLIKKKKKKKFQMYFLFLVELWKFVGNLPISLSKMWIREEDIREHGKWCSLRGGTPLFCDQYICQPFYFKRALWRRLQSKLIYSAKQTLNVTINEKCCPSNSFLLKELEPKML